MGAPIQKPVIVTNSFIQSIHTSAYSESDGRVERVKSFIAGTYDRRVTHYNQIMDQVAFKTNEPDADPARTFFDLFQLRFKRWIMGKGYSSSMCGSFVPQKIFDSEQENPAIRAQAFLLAISDSDLLPADPNDKFQVRFDFPPIVLLTEPFS